MAGEVLVAGPDAVVDAVAAAVLMPAAIEPYLCLSSDALSAGGGGGGGGEGGVLARRGGVGEVLIWNCASNMHMLLGHVM